MVSKLIFHTLTLFTVLGISIALSGCQGQVMPAAIGNANPDPGPVISYVPTQATTTPTSTHYVGVGQ